MKFTVIAFLISGIFLTPHLIKEEVSVSSEATFSNPYSTLVNTSHLIKEEVSVSSEASFSNPYSTLINQYAQMYRVDPDLVTAILYMESKFNPQAKSPKGARGLMQIMPRTACSLAKELGIDGFTSEDLYNPQINIQMGCYYLAQLKKRLGSNHNILLAAYNAGPTKVGRWLHENINKDISKLFPYPSTRAYIASVNSFLINN